VESARCAKEGLTDLMLTVHAIDHVVFNVRDTEVSADWYVRALGMERISTRTASGEIRTSVTFGRMKINLRPIDASQESWFTGLDPAAGAQDVCFLTDAEPAAVVEHFRERGIAIELGPVTKTGAQGAIRSVYVRDPDGNLIEVSSYSSG
jgi:catechol 2,3-dioxygenase-like lactoylglutathione lyase family enzyme